MAKKQNKPKRASKSAEIDKQPEVKASELESEKSEKNCLEMKEFEQATDPPRTDSDVTHTVTTTGPKKRMSGAARGVCAMHKVVMKKAQGKKLKVRYNRIGVPIGENRHALASYVGMLARTMVPIDIKSWPKVDPVLKAKLWSDVQDTFIVVPESEKAVLKSAGSKWRQFKSKLTKTYVKPYIGQKKKLSKPPKKYAFVGKEAWRRFTSMRNTTDWQTRSKEQSERVGERKYPHRTSRKGYVGLEEEEIKAGRLDPEELPDRAILWKIARIPPENEDIDEGLAETFQKIDDLLEKKAKGEFKPSGNEDVLSVALETPERAGRVRGVGSFVTPTTYFNMPKGKKYGITKAELLARDRKREEEFKMTKEELEKTKKDFMSQIDELKSLLESGSFHSPHFSDKASSHLQKEKFKAVDNEIDHCFVDIDHGDPFARDIKEPTKCELAVDTIDNIVAFGILFPDGDLSKSVHGIPVKEGHVRVSVDGIIKGDALVPVPIVGEIETVREAVGSHLAWPRDLVILKPLVEKKKKGVLKSKKPKSELDRVLDLFKNVTPNKNVPHRFRLLYKHAVTFMKEKGDSIQIPCDFDVFGIEKTIFLLHENVIALLEFEMIGQAIISTYMGYLDSSLRESNSHNYAFMDPGATYKLDAHFHAYVVRRLKAGPSRIFFMPHNENVHWILVIIWESEIFILNPLPHQTHFKELEVALAGAVRSYNAEMGRVNKNPKIKHLSGSPKQPGGHECGYVVMRYMKDIIADKEMKLLNKWATKTRCHYTLEELDDVRCETLGHIQEFV